MDTSSKPRAWLWLFVLAPLAVVATAALLVGLGLVFNASGRIEPVEAGERALLLDVDHVARWMGGYQPDPAAETVSKTRFFDDSYELEYVYDVVDDGAPYLTYSITFEGNTDDARTTYASFWGGTHVGLFVGDGEIDVAESNELFRWGDESRFGVLTAAGRPFGNVFLGRKGKRVVYFLLSGVYFDEAPVINELLGPYLERLDSISSGADFSRGRVGGARCAGLLHPPHPRPSPPRGGEGGSVGLAARVLLY